MGANGGQMAGWHIAALIAAVLAATIVMSQTVPAPPERPAGDSASQPDTAPWATEHTVCHAYPARLMSEHPLYPQLVRLDAEIARFSGISVERWERQWHWGVAADRQLVLFAPEPPQFDRLAHQEHLSGWQRGRVQGPFQPVGELAPDLQARLRWIERQLRTDLEEKLQAARYAEEVALSRKEAELVRRFQEALMNADLVGPRTTEGAGQRRSERERILSRIEQQMAEEFSASRRLLDEYEARMRQDAQLAFSAAQQQVRETMQKRLRSSVSSGSKTAERLSKRLSSLEPSNYAAPAIAWQSAGAGVLAESQEPATDVSARYGAAGERLAAALSAQKGRLSRRIYQEAVLAARKSALEAGTVLVIPPLEAPEGPDVTEQLRPQLRRLWQS